MNKILILLIILLPLFLFSENTFELNTTLMNSTFRIEGSGKTGTVFIIGKPLRTDPNNFYYVLVTANHVLEDIKTNQASIFLRTLTNDKHNKLPCKIDIRRNGNPLWIKHPEVDIAAMYINLPSESNISLLTTAFLATDSLIAKFEIHPGDELLCLGFPYGAEANKSGFPILRSGKLSSYPILPTKEVKSFLFDFQIFGGNSGGPVYFIDHNRFYQGATHIGKVRFIIGLVSKQLSVTEKITSLTEETNRKHPLGLAVVIPATYIREVVELLPDRD